MKSLGAAMFVHNGEQFDYCYKEAIDCMKTFADKVVVVDAGSTDGTTGILRSLEDEKTKVIYLPIEEWNRHRGRTKIAHFQNMAKCHLGTDYYFLLQADEILHEDCFGNLRRAVEESREGCFVGRINLWFDPWSALNVTNSRQPCSTDVIRLSKIKYNSIDDGESILVPNPLRNWVPSIRIYHMGFVRDPVKMKSKVVHIQEKVFEIQHDARVDGSEKFQPDLFFSRSDTSPIQEELPKFIQKWASERHPIKPVHRPETAVA